MEQLILKNASANFNLVKKQGTVALTVWRGRQAFHYYPHDRSLAVFVFDTRTTVKITKISEVLFAPNK